MSTGQPETRLMENDEELMRGDSESIRVIYNNLTGRNQVGAAYVEMMRAELQSTLEPAALRVEEE